MIVIDASVAMKFGVADEDDIPQALALYESHGASLYAPHLLTIEVANAIATKSARTEEEIKEGLFKFWKMGIRALSVTEAHILESAKSAKEYKTSVYDMLYAVLAKQHKAILVTADRKFIEKTKFPFVKLLTDFA